MPRRPKVKGQTAMDETAIEDPTLEQMLEDRETKREAKADATRAYKEAHELVVGAIAERDELGDDPIRVGRFRLERKVNPGRTVHFESAGSTRILISAVDEA